MGINPINAQERVQISQFSQKPNLSDWQPKEFHNTTHYKILTIDQQSTLKANSQQSASGLFKEIKVDLTKTPYLNWSWKVEQKLTGLNERSKQGDDYSARLYLVKKSKYLIWKTKALNYVWSSNQKKDTLWTNAYVKQAKMIAIRGKEAATGQWFKEKRSVLADFKRAFGEDIQTINVVAIMTDTDNSQQSATAYYRNIYFSKD
jgi:hypothetical protein